MEVAEEDRSWCVCLLKLWLREASLYCIRESMGSQWREAKWEEIKSILGTLGTRPMALFWTFCSLFERERELENFILQGLERERQRQTDRQTDWDRERRGGEEDWYFYQFKFLRGICILILSLPGHNIRDPLIPTLSFEHDEISNY